MPLVKQRFTLANGATSSQILQGTRCEERAGNADSVRDGSRNHRFDDLC